MPSMVDHKSSILNQECDCMWSYLFICGAPRSGTTFLASMLGGASNAFSLQKTPFKFRGRGGVTTHEDVRAWINNGDFILSNLGNPEFQSLPCSNADFYSEAIRRYVEEFMKGEGVPDVVVDHSPVNVMMSHLLAMSFPDAKFIHLVRDGRAVYNSVRGLQWGPSTPMAAAKWWQSYLAPGLALEQSLGRDRVLRVYYEDLVSNTESVLKEICLFSGIQYQEQMLEGAGVVLSPYARDVHKNIGKAPLASRADAWKVDLPKDEKLYFGNSNAALLAHLGYDVRDGDWFPSASLKMKILWVFKEVFMTYFVNRFRNRLRRAGSRMIITEGRSA